MRNVLRRTTLRGVHRVDHARGVATATVVKALAEELVVYVDDEYAWALQAEGGTHARARSLLA